MTKPRKPPAKKKLPGKDAATGQFLPGNRWWLQRSSHGPKPKFDNPADLWAACLEFFEHIESSPILEEKIFHQNGIITRTTVAHPRAMTVGQLCLFLDIGVSRWYAWREERPDLREILDTVDQIMRDQKLTGAIADQMNASIVARDLGLVDKQQVSGTVNLTFGEDDAECL